VGGFYPRGDPRGNLILHPQRLRARELKSAGSGQP